jgi:hypothetical protein
MADSDADLTPSYTARQAVDDAKTTALNISDRWVPEGTIIEVHFQPGVGQAGQWWFGAVDAALNWHWAKLDEDLATGGSETASIWDGVPLADTTDNVTVYAPPVLTSGSLASGNWVRIDLHRNGRWYVIISECPAE